MTRNETAPPPILQVRGLHKSFGAVVAARDVTLDVAGGEVVGVIGANGAGKTTFVNMITGWLAPGGGRILFEGRSVLGLQPRQVARLGIVRSFQVSQVFPSMTVCENLLTAVGIARSGRLGMLRPIRRDALLQHCEKQLQQYGIEEYRDQPAETLSQGVRKLLDIAMAMVGRPRLILLDEPTSGVSIEEKFALMDIVMAALAADRVTVMFVEHDMEIVERYAGRVLAFYQGGIICDAPPEVALADPAVRQYVTGAGNGERVAVG